MTSSITPCLWFDGRIAEVAEFYVGLFPDSGITRISRYPEGSPGPAGAEMTVELTVAGLPLLLLNGGPHFTLDEAFSLSVTVDGGQAEVDRLWEALIADGGAPSQCGWCRDRFGVSWQIVPVELVRLQTGSDPAVQARVMGAMLQMGKLDVAVLLAAAAG